MKRILHVVASLSVNSGVFNAAMRYYKMVDKNDFQFDFVYFKKSDDDLISENEIISNGGHVYFIPKLNLKNFFEMNSKLRTILKQNTYDCVHCHEPILVNFIQKTIRKCGVKKIIIHSHSCKLSDTVFGVIRNRLMSFGITKYGDEIVACSDKAGCYLFGEKEFHRRGKIIVNRIDPAKYLFDDGLRNSTRQMLKVPEEYLLIGSIGRCDAIKNHQFILELMRKPELKNEKVMFVLIGDGPLLESLKKKAVAYGIENRVRFVGNQADVTPFLCAMDVFLFPSLSEGFGVAFVEAQLCKLFCIASENVPIETKIGDYASFIKTDKASQNVWLKQIKSQIGIDVNDRKKRLVDPHLIDIKQGAEDLMELYSG